MNEGQFFRKIASLGGVRVISSPYATEFDFCGQLEEYLTDICMMDPSLLELIDGDDETTYLEAHPLGIYKEAHGKIAIPVHLIVHESIARRIRRAELMIPAERRRFHRINLDASTEEEYFESLYPLVGTLHPNSGSTFRVR